MANDDIVQGRWLSGCRALRQSMVEWREYIPEPHREKAMPPISARRVLNQGPFSFKGPNGRESLSDLFDGRSQLIIYHFMYGPGWDQGCKSCSFIADNFEPAIVHSNARDVSMVAIFRAPFGEFEPHRKRMGWSFKWLSSNGTDLNEDYHVSFSQEEIDIDNAYYNYKTQGCLCTEAPGATVFSKNDAGAIYNTYSVFKRGLATFATAYHHLDIVPEGRNEKDLP